MGNVSVAGSLEEVKAKLQRIKEVTVNRQVEGYPMFQHRDNWKYITVQDNNVCPTCSPLNGQLLRGDYILGDYPYFTVESKLEIKVHNSTEYHNALKCRCKAEWINRHEAVLQVIHEEISDAVGYVESRVFTRTPTS